MVTVPGSQMIPMSFWVRGSSRPVAGQNDRPLSGIIIVNSSAGSGGSEKRRSQNVVEHQNQHSRIHDGARRC